MKLSTLYHKTFLNTGWKAICYDLLPSRKYTRVPHLQLRDQGASFETKLKNHAAELDQVKLLVVLLWPKNLGSNIWALALFLINRSFPQIQVLKSKLVTCFSFFPLILKLESYLWIPVSTGRSPKPPPRVTVKCPRHQTATSLDQCLLLIAKRPTARLGHQF